MSKRIWYDGLGNKMRPATYSQNEVIIAGNNCVHELDNQEIEIFFFGGGYYQKHRKCSLCSGYVASDMVDHPTGHHDFSVPFVDEEGCNWRQCSVCSLMISALPVFHV